MTLEEFQINIEELLHEYKKDNEFNFYYTNVRDLEWILDMLKEVY
jgi:hypothetical protein